MILLAVVIFRYQRIGGPRYEPPAGGEAKNPAAQLKGVPGRQPPYELDVK